MAKRTAKKSTPNSLPPTVYVGREEDTDGTTYFTANPDPEYHAQTGRSVSVGEYRLVRTVRVVNRTTVE